MGKKVTIENRVKWCENKIDDIAGLDGKLDSVQGQFNEQNKRLNELKADIMKLGQGVIKDALNLREFMSSMSERLKHDDDRDKLIYERLGKLEGNEFQKDVDAHRQSHEKWSDEILKLRERVKKFEDYIMAPPSDISILADRIGKLEKIQSVFDKDAFRYKQNMADFHQHQANKIAMLEREILEHKHKEAPKEEPAKKSCMNCRILSGDCADCNDHSLWKPRDDDPTKEKLKREIDRTLSRVSSTDLFAELCYRDDVEIQSIPSSGGMAFVIGWKRK